MDSLRLTLVVEVQAMKKADMKCGKAPKGGGK